jgi:hypothetical protein
MRSLLLPVARATTVSPFETRWTVAIGGRELSRRAGPRRGRLPSPAGNQRCAAPLIDGPVQGMVRRLTSPAFDCSSDCAQARKAPAPP